MTDELIELVRDRKVLYDTKCKEYKDQMMRNAAWEEIAEILKVPVNECKDNWAKLRNAFASALKRRRNKKSGQAAAAFVPWKYEESMSFLLPYMECRNTRTNVLLPPESPTTDDSHDENFPASPSTTCSRSQSNSSREQGVQKPKLQELYDLMKSSQDLRRQKQSIRHDMDETDLFFLSMSKALKALPKLDQTKIKLDLHTAISQAEIRLLEHREKILRTPLKIITKKNIQSNPQGRSSTDIQPTTFVHSSTNILPSTHAQSSSYIQSLSFPSTSSSQRPTNVVLNSDDSQRFIQSIPRDQSSAYFQTPADVHSSTYDLPTTHSPSATCTPSFVQLSSFPSDDLKSYYDKTNFDNDEDENDGCG